MAPRFGERIFSQLIHRIFCANKVCQGDGLSQHVGNPRIELHPAVGRADRLEDRRVRYAVKGSFAPHLQDRHLGWPTETVLAVLVTDGEGSLTGAVLLVGRCEIQTADNGGPCEVLPGVVFTDLLASRPVGGVRGSVLWDHILNSHLPPVIR